MGYQDANLLLFHHPAQGVFRSNGSNSSRSRVPPELLLAQVVVMLDFGKQEAARACDLAPAVAVGGDFPKRGKWVPQLRSLLMVSSGLLARLVTLLMSAGVK